MRRIHIPIFFALACFMYCAIEWFIFLPEDFGIEYWTILSPVGKISLVCCVVSLILFLSIPLINDREE